MARRRKNWTVVNGKRRSRRRRRNAPLSRAEARALKSVLRKHGRRCRNLRRRNPYKAWSYDEIHLDGKPVAIYERGKWRDESGKGPVWDDVLAAAMRGRVDTDDIVREANRLRYGGR